MQRRSNGARNLLFGPRDSAPHLSKAEELAAKFKEVLASGDRRASKRLAWNTSWNEKVDVVPLLSEDEGALLLETGWRSWALPDSVYSPFSLHPLSIFSQSRSDKNFILSDYQEELKNWVGEGASQSSDRKANWDNPLNLLVHHGADYALESAANQEAHNWQKLISKGAHPSEENFKKSFEENVRPVLKTMIEKALANRICIYGTEPLQARKLIEEIMTSKKPLSNDKIMMASEHAATIFATERCAANQRSFDGKDILEFCAIWGRSSNARWGLTLEGAEQLQKQGLGIKIGSNARRDDQNLFCVSTRKSQDDIIDDKKFRDSAVDTYARALGISPEQSRNYLKKLGAEVERVQSSHSIWPVFSGYLERHNDETQSHGPLINHLDRPRNWSHPSQWNPSQRVS
jgi:hypothetical protein